MISLWKGEIYLWSVPYPNQKAVVRRNFTKGWEDVSSRRASGRRVYLKTRARLQLEESPKAGDGKKFLKGSECFPLECD